MMYSRILPTKRTQNSVFTTPKWIKKAKDALVLSFGALSHARLRRLVIEDVNVEASCWFSRRRSDFFHVPAQILRFLVQVILAPLYVIIPREVYDRIYANAPWALKLTSTPEVVLTNAPDGGAGVYAPTGSDPLWLLKVQIVDGTILFSQQVRWSEEVRNRGYTALSYPMDSAYVLFQEAGLTVEAAPTEKRRFTLKDRKRIAERLLIEYCSATRSVGNRTEYIWLDEFCLSDITQPDNSPERKRELGRLSDIFRNASQVAVFCNEENCDHTSTTCIWGERLFTIGEILHAATVIRLTRQREQDGSLRTHVYREPAHSFRGRMQSKAAYNNRWHLYAIMQHSTNAGSIPWQNAIHALVVEAITRDLAGTGFEEHKFLGKALNGLLPRRARPEDLKGEDGWKDLAWLLELNQGFFNAASLAAVCSLGEGGWLGPPIKPDAGNERLEPIVHAFPVGAARTGTTTPLCIIGSKTVELRDSLKRDPFGLYTNKDMRALKWLSMGLLVMFFIGGLVTYFVCKFYICIAIIWSGSSSFVIFEMVVGTIYLQRDGWIFLDRKPWGDEPQHIIGKQDPKLAELVEWGDRQLIPTWSPPTGKDTQHHKGSLLDLKNRMVVKVIVTEKPNALVALAIHGSGVTSMLVERKVDLDGVMIGKVGMCNLPAYVLAQTIRSGTLCIGMPLEDEGESEREAGTGGLGRLLSCLLDLFT